jgi:KTSC domain
MKRMPVTSSTVATVGYDPNSMTLEIEFTSSSVYQYFDVPEVEYRNLISAESIGEYFSQNIKDKYRCARI